MNNDIIALALLLVSGYAGAQVIGESPVRTFEEADFNADGMLNEREADSALPALGLRDSDGDGVITREDVKKVLPDIQFIDEADADEPIRAAEYQQIVQTVQDMLGANQALR